MGRLIHALTLGLAISFSVCGVAFAQESGAAETGSSATAADAGVRIVRLSAVRGKVELDRGTGRGFEPGFMNLPIVQGSRLRTVGLGWAEVEFEDGGSARITPDTQLAFTALSRGPQGQLRNELRLSSGTLHVSRMKGDNSDLVILAGGRKFLLPPSSHARLDVYPAGSELVVVHGSVRVEDETGATTLVDRKQALKFDGRDGTQQLVHAKGEAPGLYDRWDAQAAEYHNHLVGGGGLGSLYGGRDLQYYGDFQNEDGCGRVWQPYLAGAGFDPAASGVWAWYPGAGYAFVSPYAWGWTTFNSGEWVSCGANGWGWRPGAWRGLKNHPIVEPIHGPGHHPRPLSEPAAGKPTVVNAGEHELVRSQVIVEGASRFAPGSGGLGIPRGSVENLKQISRAVEAGKTTPEPAYTSDPVATDPLALTLIAERTGTGLRIGEGAGGRSSGLVALNSRPIANQIVAGRSGGGYAGGRTGSSGAGASFGGGNFARSSSGVSVGAAQSVSTSSSASASRSTGGSSTGSSGGSSGSAGHK